MTQKCNSCVKGFDGRKGNGYQPCSCLKKPEFVPAPEPIKIETRSKNRTSFWGKWFK